MKSVQQSQQKAKMLLSNHPKYDDNGFVEIDLSKD